MTMKPSREVYEKAVEIVENAVDVGRRQIDLINDGHSNEVVLTETRRRYPGMGTENTVPWYRHKVNVIRRWNGLPNLPG
jgi:hypothetical protein